MVHKLSAKVEILCFTLFRQLYQTKSAKSCSGSCPDVAIHEPAEVMEATAKPDSPNGTRFDSDPAESRAWNAGEGVSADGKFDLYGSDVFESVNTSVSLHNVFFCMISTF